MSKFRAKLRSTGERQTVRIAIIDSGIDMTKFREIYPEAKKVFYYDTFSKTEPMLPDSKFTYKDPTRHGTTITAIIYEILCDEEAVEFHVYKVTEGATHEADVARIIRALIDAIRNRKCNLINMSLGTADVGTSSLFHENFRALLSIRDALVVAASGNSGRDRPPTYPARLHEHPELVWLIYAVGALDKDRKKPATYSQYPPTIYAPGHKVAALKLGETTQPGTSYATAIVTGFLASFILRGASREEIRRAVGKLTDVDGLERKVKRLSSSSVTDDLFPAEEQLRY